MSPLTSQEKTDLVRQHEAHTQGSTKIWPTLFGSLNYTDGIRCIEETCGAHWLTALVESHQPAINKNHPNTAHFQVWQIARNGEGGVCITAWSDTPGSVDDKFGPASILMAKQDVEYTDFPEELMPYEFWVESGTMLMKAEH